MAVGIVVCNDELNCEEKEKESLDLITCMNFLGKPSREMIEIMMKEVGKLSVKNQSMFDVNDLYKPRNSTQVLEFIVALRRLLVIVISRVKLYAF